MLVVSPNLYARSETARLGAGFSISSVSYSEPVSIKANFDDWETESFQSGNQLYSKQVARIGMSYSNIELGYSKHLYYYLNFSPDTALLHYLERNGRLSQNKRPLDLYLNANNAEGEGIFLGYNFDWRNLRVGAKLTYLSLQDLYYGEAYGRFDPGQSTSNSTHIIIDYAYPEDRIFERNVLPPEGTGVTLDINMEFDWQQHWAAANIGEALSDLYWNTAPGSRIEGDLNDLFLREDAAVKFSHFRTRFHQRLPVHTELKYRYRLAPSFSTGFEYEKLDAKDWKKIVADWHMGNSWTGTLKWVPADSAWGIRINHPYFLLDLETDSSDYRKSHFLKLVLSAAIQI